MALEPPPTQANTAVTSAQTAVQQATIERFLSCFSDVGFRRSAMMPSYGLAEATLLVTSARARTGERRPDSVSVGTAAGDYRVLVVDPLFGLLGGLIGYAVFKSKTPAVPPQPPLPPQ